VLLENGKKIEITAKNQADDAVYVSSLSLNRKTYTHNFLRIKDLNAGAKLQFDMSQKPNYKRGTNKEDAPYSFSNELLAN